MVHESVARRLGVKLYLETVSLTVYRLELSQIYNDQDSYDIDMNAQDVPAGFLKGLALGLIDPIHYSAALKKNAYSFLQKLSLYELMVFLDPSDIFIFNDLALLYVNASIDCTLLIESFTKAVGCY